MIFNQNTSAMVCTMQLYSKNLREGARQKIDFLGDMSPLISQKCLHWKAIDFSFQMSQRSPLNNANAPGLEIQIGLSNNCSISLSFPQKNLLFHGNASSVIYKVNDYLNRKLYVSIPFLLQILEKILYCSFLKQQEKNTPLRTTRKKSFNPF